jgi:outer membrane protein assembly factor BamA
VKLFFILFLFLTSEIFCQIIIPRQDLLFKPFRVDSIAIVGNDITEPEIILTELTFAKGEVVDSTKLRYNRERIYSLGIFTNVKLYPEAHEDKTTLIIDVSESWYIWPIPFIALRDRDWKKATYGIDVLIMNFRGRNEKLRTSFSLGYDPSLTLQYSKPYWFRKEAIYFDASFVYVNQNNKSKNAEMLFGEKFKQKFISGNITLGKRFNLFNKADVYGGFSYVETPKYIPGINAADSRIDRLPFLGLRYYYDSRDLAQFPKDGTYFNADILKKGFGQSGVDYNIFSADYREYKTVYKSLSSKWRLTTRQTFGKLIPFYDNSFLGYSERIRGHFTTISEGNNLYLSQLEFKYPLLKEINIHFNLPLIPEALLSYRVEIYAQVFAEGGVTQLRGKSINLSHGFSGYGFGFTGLVLPYNIARMEFALNELGKTEIIFDLGISF